MINKLRFKFIRITMFSVLAVLVLIAGSINIVNIYNENHFLDAVTERILANSGRYKHSIPINKTNKNDEESLVKAKKKIKRLINNISLPFLIRYINIFLDSDYKIKKYRLKKLINVPESEINEIKNMVLINKKDVGWYHNYRYRIGKCKDGFLIIALEASDTKNSIFSILTITIIISVAAFFIVFIFIIFFSRRAILPVANSYEKQKQFITDASHELKTPLTVILANTEIMRITYGDSEWCDGIKRQAGLMHSLINQMIQMSKLDEGKQQFAFSSFNICEALCDTALSFSFLADQKKLKLNVETGPDFFINADEAAIRQVFTILMDNAVKYCDENGQINIFAKIITKGFGHEKIMISIRNTFFNVQEVDTEKIFERFYREDKARIQNNSYGLGLSIARSIISSHKGTMQAKKLQNEIEFIIILGKVIHKSSFSWN